VDDHSHRCPSKLRHKLFHSLYKCGRGEFVGLFREETEPTDVCLPPGDRHFLILLLVVLIADVPLRGLSGWRTWHHCIRGYFSSSNRWRMADGPPAIIL
jgi:hypothetical protein